MEFGTIIHCRSEQLMEWDIETKIRLSLFVRLIHGEALRMYRTQKIFVGPDHRVGLNARQSAIKGIRSPIRSAKLSSRSSVERA